MQEDGGPAEFSRAHFVLQRDKSINDITNPTQCHFASSIPICQNATVLTLILFMFSKDIYCFQASPLSELGGYKVSSVH